VTQLLVTLSIAEGEVAAALRVAEDCVAQHPKLAGPRASLAAARLAAGEPDAARAALLAGLRLSPNDFECNLRLGLMERELGDPCAAVEPLARAAASELAPSVTAREFARELWEEVRKGCH
jgi:predicted Zn-dependent protease